MESSLLCLLFNCSYMFQGLGLWAPSFQLLRWEYFTHTQRKVSFSEETLFLFNIVLFSGCLVGLWASSEIFGIWVPGFEPFLSIDLSWVFFQFVVFVVYMCECDPSLIAFLLWVFTSQPKIVHWGPNLCLDSQIFQIYFLSKIGSLSCLGFLWSELLSCICLYGNPLHTAPLLF